MNRERIFGCEVIEDLHLGARSHVLRCRRLDDGQRVVVKLPAAGAAESERIRALCSERDALRQLRLCSSVVRLVSFEAEAGRCGLLLEDVPGTTLDGAALAGTMDIPGWLALAAELGRALDDVHRHGVFHNDINPSNVLVDADGSSLKLIDFASARLTDEPVPSGSGLGACQGPLAYMSPERTGRLRREVGQRSDLYSLGVVVFELLTGRLPFSYDDPLELVHAHLARAPPHPSDLVPGLAPSISAIVLKLLAKDPDDRYQSAAQLVKDLEASRADSSAELDAVISSARQRANGDFRLPQRLYGREGELQRLMAAHAAALGGARIVRLTGPAGAGKSALARELGRRVTAASAHFVSGGFDPYGGGVPHDALAQSLDSLARQLLTQKAKRVAAWRVELTAALGGTGRVLCDICPRLEHVLGEQRGAQAVPNAARSQLVQAVTAILDRVAAAGQPVCLFLDDMQWARSESLAVLKDVIVGCRETALLVLTAHRSSGQSDDPLGRWFADLEQAGIPSETIHLTPLSGRDITALVQDTLALVAAEAEPLAEIVMARTRGNPFFARAFLESLHADGLLAGPAYDVEDIRRRGVTDNVVELLIERIGRLQSDKREVLRVAACLGSSFDLSTLDSVMGRPAGPDLAQAVAAELVLPLDTSGTSAMLRGGVRFAHDGVRQAILSTLDEQSRRRIHLALGRFLISDSAIASSDRVFRASKHLNEARELIRDPEERLRLARLNLDAARAAVVRAAAGEAVGFARSGMVVVPGSAWEEHHDLMRDLHLVAAEAAFESADHETLGAFAAALLEHARTPIEAARIHWLQGRVHQAQSRAAQAMETFCSALSGLGVGLPRDPSPEQIQRELEQTAALLAGRTLAELVDLPRATEPQACVAAELLSKLIFVAYADANPILPLVICRLVRLSLRAGNTGESANGYTFYGLLLASDGDHDRAFAFGRVALEVAHRLGDSVILSQTYLYTTYLLMHWTMPLAELAEPLREAYRHGLESGSPLNTACSATTLCISRFWAGDELARLMVEMRAYRKVVVRFRQTRVLNWLEIVMQTVENLRSDTVCPTRLQGPLYDEEKRLPEHVHDQDKTALFNLNVARTFVCYLFGDYQTALTYSESNRSTPALFISSFWAVPVTFLDALCCLANCNGANELKRGQLLAQARVCAEQLLRWQSHNPREIEHKLRLVQAETARVEGNAELARRRYDEAREMGGASLSPLDQAIICEAAGRFELACGDRNKAQRHLRTAHRAYSRWGAVAKARAIERDYPSLLRASLAGAVSLWPFAGAEQDFDFLDLASILSASRLLSSEIRLERLLERLMTLLVEAAGAQMGCLLLRRDGGWVVEAARSMDRGRVSVLEALPPHALVSRGLEAPLEPVLNYVASTGETVVLQDDNQHEQFRREGHDLEGHRGSVLCFPLKRQGGILAIAYLENHLTRNAFTGDSVKVLEMLSAQAAVSLENARLYEELEQRVESRTRELREKNEELAGALARLMEIQRQMVTQEKLAALGALAGGIAHEIKNPLNFITNFADSAARIAEELVTEIEPELGRLWPKKQSEVTDLVEDLRTATRKIGEHSARAAAIVNEMALHARGGGERQTVDLNDLVRRSLSLATADRSERCDDEVAIVADYDATVGGVDVVVQDLTRVFVNLLNNAFDAVKEKLATTSEGYRPSIRITTRNLGDRVEVSVRDNGLGVAPNLRDKIFVPFFTTKAAGQGTGLGLSISHDIVVRGHEGALSCSSAVGEFAEFTVSLPARRANAIRTPDG